jgi:hypothetical protein
MDITFMRGGLSLVAGTPGSMKTMLIGNLVDEMKIPTLYISNDSNEATIASRLIARRTKQDSRKMREKAKDNPEWASRIISDMDWVKWNFSSSPTLEEIEEEIQAFEELYGDAPHLVVVDVLMKVDYAEESEHGTHERIIQYLDHLGRTYSAHIMVACHTSENVPGTPCQPMAAILNKITKIPTMVLTVARQDETLYVAPVKNRDGFSDSSGKTTVTLHVDPSTATVGEW